MVSKQICTDRRSWCSIYNPYRFTSAPPVPTAVPWRRLGDRGRCLHETLEGDVPHSKETAASAELKAGSLCEQLVIVTV